MKFGRLVQTDMPTAGVWSKSKPEVEFQYSGRLVFETGNSYISAVDWAITTKFGVLIDTDLLKTATSANPKPEVKLRRSGRHLDNQFNIIISAEDGPLWTKFGSLMHNSAADCQISLNFAWWGSFLQNTHVPQNLFFCFPNAVWALASGGFGIVSETLVWRW